MPNTLPDLTDREGIESLVNSFYGTVRQDETLGFIFDEVAQVNRELHLPKMYAFRETVLFRSGGYKGDPIGAHSRFGSKTEMGKPQFDHWLKLFRETVDSLFCGENTEHIKSCAEDMANVICGKINRVKDPRFNQASLTPEQRARFAEYTNKKATDT